MRVNDRRRFYAHFEDLALVLVVFCDMVWIKPDFDVCFESAYTRKIQMPFKFG